MNPHTNISSGTLPMILGMLLISSDVVYSQVTAGRLVGIVTGSEAAELAGAHVVVRNIEDGSERGAKIRRTHRAHERACQVVHAIEDIETLEQ